MFAKFNLKETGKPVLVKEDLIQAVTVDEDGVRVWIDLEKGVAYAVKETFAQVEQELYWSE